MQAHTPPIGSPPTILVRGHNNPDLLTTFLLSLSDANVHSVGLDFNADSSLDEVNPLRLLRFLNLKH